MHLNFDVKFIARKILFQRFTQGKMSREEILADFQVLPASRNKGTLTQDSSFQKKQGYNHVLAHKPHILR